MPDKNPPIPGHDADRQSQGSARWDKAEANGPWAEQRAIAAGPIAVEDRAKPRHAGPAMVRNSHLARLVEALEESRRLQVRRINRGYLHLVPQACE